VTEFVVDEVVKLEIFVPPSHLDAVRDALVAIGVGVIGNYDSCSNVSMVMGSFRPMGGSTPFVGEVGQLEMAEECRLEMNCPRDAVTAALATIRGVHPYETPPVNIIPLLNHLFT
jgi:hypothetical protein